jgi:hypothetical protein
MVGLGDPAGPPFHSVALSISGDGSVILCAGQTATSEEYFIWTSAHGFQSVRDLLLAAGVTSVSGWQLNAHHGSISADGRVVVGYGTNPAGQTEAWMARLPAVCYADCNADGALNLADFGCFQTKFALGEPYADCNGDGAMNLADFGCFQTRFAIGCP